MNATFLVATELDWAELYQSYFQRIYNYIYKRTSDQVLSEDLTADTFAKAIAFTQQGKGAQKSFSGWIFRIAHNLVIDHYRFRDRHKQVCIDDVWQMPDSSNNPVLAAEREFDIESLRSVLQHLTPEQAQVLFLRFEHGYAFDDIAKRLSKSKEAIKALQHRALAAAQVLLIENLDATSIPGIKNKTQVLIYQTLCKYGPSTVMKIIECTDINRVTAQIALKEHPKIFCRMGFDRWDKRSIVWGLVGIHDRQTT